MVVAQRAIFKAVRRDDAASLRSWPEPYEVVREDHAIETQRSLGKTFLDGALAFEGRDQGEEIALPVVGLLRDLLLEPLKYLLGVYEHVAPG